jgi:hypothetical protein
MLITYPLITAVQIVSARMEAKAFYGHLHRDHRRHDHELHSDRSDPGPVLERRDQRRGRRSGQGDHDVAGRGAKVMGDLAITGWTKGLGWVATAAMVVAVAAMLATS